MCLNLSIGFVSRGWLSVWSGLGHRITLAGAYSCLGMASDFHSDGPPSAGLGGIGGDIAEDILDPQIIRDFGIYAREFLGSERRVRPPTRLPGNSRELIAREMIRLALVILRYYRSPPCLLG